MPLTIWKMEIGEEVVSEPERHIRYVPFTLKP
jgi:hypothetical protein